MSRGRCKTCKHWEKFDYKPNPVMGVCSKMSVDSSLPVCPETLAHADMECAKTNEVITHPYFGCFMWEAKE